VKSETWIAIYAAIIATSALLLNLKTWWDSGVRLKLNLIPDGLTIGGGIEFEESNIVILTVTNRGHAPTVIRNMILFENTSWWQLRRIRPRKSYVIPNPQLKGYPRNIPADLPPSRSWTGAIRQRPDVIPNIYTGHFYTGVYTSDRDKPYLTRIPSKKEYLPKGTKTLG
jgi:hypothetical protein